MASQVNYEVNYRKEHPELATTTQTPLYAEAEVYK